MIYEFITLNIPYDGVDDVHIPDGITKTDYTKISVETGFKTLPYGIFKNFINVVDIDLPDSIEKIYDQTFANTKIKYLKLPKNLSIVAIRNPFDDPDHLEYIDAPHDCIGFKSIDGVLFNKNMTKLIQFPRAKKLTKYIVPSEVETIGFAAFRSLNHLKKIVLPEATKYIDSDNFNTMGSNLKSIIVIRNSFSSDLDLDGNTFVNTNFQKNDIKFMNLTQYLESEYKTPSTCQMTTYNMKYGILLVIVLFE